MLLNILLKGKVKKKWVFLESELPFSACLNCSYNLSSWEKEDAMDSGANVKVNVNIDTEYISLELLGI